MSAFLLWLSTVLGVRLDPDGHYGNQCVDTVDHYAEFLFGVPWRECVGGVAGAKQLLDAAPDEYWTRIDYYHGFIPAPGDVLVYAGDDVNPWGHTAITETATHTTIHAIQQDGFAAPHQYVDGNWYSAKPAHRARLAYSAKGTGRLLGILRPRPEKITAARIGTQSTSITPAPETPKEWDEMASKEEIFEAVWGGPGTGMIFNNELQREEYPRTTLGAMTDRIIRQQLLPLRAEVHGLIGALQAVAGGEPFDEAKLLEGVRAAAAQGVKDGIDSIATTVTLKENPHG